nr:MAG TPA: hypothetical protein [Caudoviricetes sp.]
MGLGHVLLQCLLIPTANYTPMAIHVKCVPLLFSL